MQMNSLQLSFHPVVFPGGEGGGRRDLAPKHPRDPKPPGLRPSQRPMDDKKKKRSPKPCLAQPAQAPGTLRRVPVPTSHSGSLALGLPHLPSPKQRAKFKRVGKEKCRPVLAGGGSGSAGTPLQHSFLTEVTDVYEMEGGLLNLLNDFHSGRLQAFGESWGLVSAGLWIGLEGPVHGAWLGPGFQESFPGFSQGLHSREGVLL
ncbi:hypothetical protein H8959_005277 [Pygathrix nigripes]